MKDSNGLEILSENMRHYANMRFKQLTLFFAVTAGLFSVVFYGNINLHICFQYLLRAMGILGTMVFWLMEESAVKYWTHYKTIAIKYEEKDNIKIYDSIKCKRPLRATNAVRFLYFMVGLFWFISIVIHLCKQF